MNRLRRRALRNLFLAPLACAALAREHEPDPAQPALPAWVPRPGETATVSRNRLTDVDPCPARSCSYAGVEGQKGVFAFSGGAFAEDYGRLGAYIVTGGGHSAYHGNEVYVFPLEQRRWIRLTEPYPSNGLLQGKSRGLPAASGPEIERYWPGFDMRWGDYEEAIPEAGHTYGFVDVLPASAGGGPSGSLIRLIGVAAGKASLFFGGTHVCDLATGRWSRYARTNVSGPAGGAAYDAARKRFYLLCAGSTSFTHTMRFLDTSLRTWHTYSTSEVPITIESAACIFPPADLFVYVLGQRSGPPQVWALPLEDKARPVWRRLSTAGNGPVREGGASLGFGLTYCPLDGALYCVPGGRNSGFWKLSPPARSHLAEPWTWSREPLTAPLDIRQGGYVYNRLRWAPAVKSFVWVDGVQGGVQLIRPRSAI
jgi:hypothetical protein